MNKTTIIPASQSKLKSLWTSPKEDYTSNKPIKPSTKLTKSTKITSKNKIMLNKDTWVTTDHHGINRVETSKKEPIEIKNTPNVSYPVLRLISDEIPNENIKFNNLDMCLIKNINEICVYKDGQFEFINIHE